jgi:hypothetical protein
MVFDDVLEARYKQVVVYLDSENGNTGTRDKLLQGRMPLQIELLVFASLVIFDRARDA